MRRLSVSGNDKPESTPDVGTPSQGTGGRRARRMSMSPEMGVVKPLALLPFPPEVVGTYSCHGVEPGVKAGETHAKINQDRGCVCYPFGPTDGPNVNRFVNALFCVFDGHGAVGDKVSHYAMNNIQKKLEEKHEINSDDDDVVKRIMEEVFVEVDTELQKSPDVDAELSGTTAVVCLCRWERANPDCAKLFVANAGDSRAVMAVKSKPGLLLKADDLTEDQKPDTPAEMRRIRQKGGYVSPPEEEWGGPARVWLDASMTLPGLAMARSIGDHLVGNIGVIAKPEVTVKMVDLKKDLFMVMASDGVWEFIDSQPAVEIINNFIEASATDACTRLIETAAAKWRAEEGDYRDDITAVCVRFRDLFDQEKSA